MKIKLIAYLILIWILSSCSNDPVKDRIIIKGSIPELASKALQVNFKDSTHNIMVDNQGDFRFHLLLNKPQYIHIKALNRKLFLIPNDSIFIEKRNDKYIFSGNQCALINNYYSDWYIYKETVADTADFESYYNKPPQAFLKSVNKWNEVYKKPLYELQKNNPNLNSDFIFLENERIKYMIYGDLNDYKNESPVIPDNFYQYLKKVNLNDTNLMQFDEYGYFLSSYIRMKVNKLNLEDKINETSKTLDIILETFQHELILNEMSNEFIKLQTNRLYVNDSLIDRFKSICTNTEYVTNIEKYYESLRPLLKGNNAPDFEFVGLNDNKVALNDFKGKYLLIDVWSTTCAPCIREIPYVERLKQEFKEKNIEFIAACLSGESAWKKTLTKHGLKEGQYRIENGWKSEFRTDYLKSSGVPVYILIDPQGLIIDARAPKPSENLREIIKNLNT